MEKKRAGEDFEKVEVFSRQEWREWLASHYTQTQSVWVVVVKKGLPGHITYDDLVEEALCYGWVDGLIRGLDARRSMLLVSPRRPKSGWSALNKKRVAKLEAEGLLAEPGIRVIEAAKASGTWSLLDDVDALIVPDDLAEALDSLPPAKENWEVFPKSIRRGILEWILQAKKPETRSKRVLETAEKASRNERALQPNRKSPASDP